VSGGAVDYRAAPSPSTGRSLTAAPPWRRSGISRTVARVTVWCSTICSVSLAPSL